MPLNFDLPLEQLKTYQGTNPRPEDFDAYWADGLAELEATDPEPQWTPDEAFQTSFADCLHLRFTGVGGARIHAKVVRPRGQDGAQPGPAVLMFHGYTGNAGDWLDKLPYAAAGMTLAALDCRGQAGESEDNATVSGWTLSGHIVRGLGDSPRKFYYRAVFLDTVQLARVLMATPGIDPTRLGATGWSQGGALTVACAALEPRIKLAAPVFPFLSDYQRVWAADLGQDPYKELKDWLRRFDPRHEREQEIFTQLGYIDIQHLAPRIRARVRWTIGLQDQICPPSSQFAAYNKIAAPKEMIFYPDYGHEGLPDVHDRIFQFMGGL